MDCPGLFCIVCHQPRQLPLHHARIDASLFDLCAEVKVQQTFVNDAPPSSPPLECFYTFPLDEESAVFSFAADLDGVISHGKIKERKEAQAEYEVAVSQNQSAMLLEQSADNVFHCRIGTLRPGSVCTITITYLTQLEQEGRSNRFTLPMIVAPKYNPGPWGPTPPFGEEALLEASDVTDRVHSRFQCDHCLCTPIIGTRHYCTVCPNYNLCDGCSTQPGLHYSDHSMSTCTDPDTRNKEEHVNGHQLTHPGLPSAVDGILQDLTITMSVRMPSPIVSIRCPSHSEETRIQQEPGSEDCATVSFHSTSSCSLSCDFILLIEQERCFDPRLLCELDMANRSAAVSLAFFPPALDMLSASQLRCELVFLLDCSGSMDGSSILCVRECMHILLRSLPVNSLFNVIAFGSSWASLFPRSQGYNDKSLSAATEYVAQLDADLGGTEIYPPLHHALTSALLDTHPRQVFLLTDGQVSNVQQLVQLTSQYAANTRLFTVGIGTAVDRALCKKLAQAGRGKCEFVTATDAGGGDMREKVVRQVARAMQPGLTDVNVNWKELNPGGYRDTECGIVEGAQNPCTASFLQCPSVAPAIFMNSRFVLHALNAYLPESVWEQVQTGQEPSFRLVIEITARSNHPHEPDCMRKTVQLTGKQITQAAVIHTLAARARIRELEDCVIPKSDGETKKKLEDEILRLALQHSLTSSRTSFVVVYHTGQEEEVAQLQPHGNDFMGFASPLCAAMCPPQMDFLALDDPVRCPEENESFAMLEAEVMTKHATCPPQMDFQALFNCGRCPQENESFAKLEAEACDDKAFVVETVTSSKEEASAKKTSTFEDLIKLQSASGVWNLTPALMDIIHTLQPSSAVTLQSLEAVGRKYGVDQEVIGIILVLTLLEKQYKQRQTEWQMLATKAQYFVSKHAEINEDLQKEITADIQKQMAQTL